MTNETFELTADSPPKRRRVARDPRPRFQEDKAGQLDPIRGCPELQVPEDHLAREVKLMVDLLDLSAVENKYSALGRRGFTPKSQLAVWVYGSLIGVHSSNRLAAQLKTDAALQFLSGGHLISSGTLRRFRNQNAELFADAILQSVALAEEWGLLDLEEGAVDMAQSGAKERYNKRIATIEPVFSMIEHTMGYRRVGTRDDEGIRAEILLKILAYNLSRLTSAYQASSLTVLQIVF